MVWVLSPTYGSVYVGIIIAERGINLSVVLIKQNGDIPNLPRRQLMITNDYYCYYFLSSFCMVCCCCCCIFLSCSDVHAVFFHFNSLRKRSKPHSHTLTRTLTNNSYAYIRCYNTDTHSLAHTHIHLHISTLESDIPRTTD